VKVPLQVSIGVVLFETLVHWIFEFVSGFDIGISNFLEPIPGIIPRKAICN